MSFAFSFVLFSWTFMISGILPVVTTDLQVYTKWIYIHIELLTSLDHKCYKTYLCNTTWVTFFICFYFSASVTTISIFCRWKCLLVCVILYCNIALYSNIWNFYLRWIGDKRFYKVFCIAAIVFSYKINNKRHHH